MQKGIQLPFTGTMGRNLLILLLIFTGLNTAISQTVQTQYGPVAGHLNGTVFEFLGIPYASPPMGELRWKPTEAPSVWTAPFIADSFPPACPQKRYTQGQPDSVFVLEGNEDCLYLNVWTPDTSADLPVMVFIHGGGNQQGSTGELSGGTILYHGKNLSRRGDVVVVTIQYRLGVLGFLVHPGLESENSNGTAGNYAVKDQLFALQWVQNNISNFGGDPGNVTIFGESAGGVNVGNLLTCPLAAGLFQRAIIESAAPVLAAYEGAKIKGSDFVNEFITSGSDSAKIAYMRTVPADSITMRMSPPIVGGLVQQSWQPVVDGQIFTDFSKNIFQSGNYNHVPLITGTNSEEMAASVFGYPEAIFPWLVDSLINTIFPAGLQPTAHALYPSDPPAVAKESYIGLLTDSQFTTPVRHTAQCVSLNQQEPVWRYLFTHKHTFLGGSAMGSYHGMELFYVFNNWENATLGSGFLFKPADDSVQQLMLGYWTNFARTGDPNDGVFPAWPVSLASTDCYMELKATPDGSQCGLRTAKSDLWDTLAGYVPCTSSTGFTASPSDVAAFFYPNPSDGYIKLQHLTGEYKIRVYNAMGRIILEGKNLNYLDLGREPSGIYLAELIRGGNSHSYRLLLR